MLNKLFFSSNLLLIAAVMVALIATPVSASLIPSLGISVKQTGAVGDGYTDDTEAFKKAIERAKSEGRPVIVPRGKYRITGTLELTAQSMIGELTAAWGADADPMPELLVTTKTGPTFRLNAGGSLHGLIIRYKWDCDEPEPRPAVLELAGVGCRVTEVKIFGAWDAITVNEKKNPARSMIKDVFIVDVHNIGLKMTGTYDVTWIQNVEVWSPGSKNFPKNGIGILLGKNDMLLLSNCFVFTAHTGYKLLDDLPGSEIKGGTWGSFSNCTTDFCSVGFEVNGTHTISIAGGQHWSHWGGMVIKGKGADVRVSGCEFSANGAPAVTIEGGKNIIFSGCQLRRNANNFKSPSLRITGGENVAISGCIITSSVEALDINKDLKGVVLTGNIVKENVTE